jgi:hypothetical protein
MGADLIVIAIPVRETGIWKDKTMEQRRRAIYTAAKQMTLAEIKKQALDSNYDFANKKDVYEVISEFFACLGYRDVTSFRHQDDTIYITGGMSYGDDPTDSYMTFEKFYNLPTKLLETAGIYY